MNAVAQGVRGNSTPRRTINEERNDPTLNDQRRHQKGKWHD
jgi:hypothetical protein